MNTEFFLSTNSKRDKEGNLIYYPIAIFGRGYKVPSRNDESKLLKSAARFNLITIPVFILVAAYVSFTVAVCGLVITVVFLHMLSWRTYRTWEIVNQRLKYKEILARKKERLKGTIIYLIWCISCLLFIVGVEFIWLKLDDGYIPELLVFISPISAILSWKALMSSQ